MKKLLLISSFVLLGSLVVASEENNDNTNNQLLYNRNSKEIIGNYIKENSIKTAGMTLGLGVFLAAPFISATNKITLSAGIIIGASGMLKVLDEGAYNDISDEARYFYTDTVLPALTKIKALYNEKMSKKD